MREECVICGSAEPSHQGGLCPEHTYDDECIHGLCTLHPSCLSHESAVDA